ncbi:hypothetical protein CC85DRAFT_158012 [Cutaneotrichosporon oleaginosum]|uniref:Uncharacterized protein n=1 Tax=Cutaneotrichosporon oleaginosum TaxID=879819 RepID=A0A0J0XGR4_9TREE|nr:uncharacterized protein CC85DRAFT_158012 [Cutaneotrichosporon oleaginosum]KLT40285.1 hypothetical protein CC85DRAFT_158012 [Cutaneotrichosporon oleaginosum]TXT08002.1 hypothetical protein COLE_04926 [Cutaneotrichosporon oleaginosum]
MGRRWSAFECIARTVPVYVYGMLPVIWVLIRSDQVGKLDSGLGIWWGTYCIADISQWRTVRLATLLMPLGLTALLTLNIARMAGGAYLLAEARTSTLVNLFALSLLGILYLALEATIGWQPNWRPRALEPLFCLVVLFQSEFFPYADAIACGLCARRVQNMSNQHTDSPPSGCKEDREEQVYAWPSRQPHRRGFLTPIPETTEGSTISHHFPQVPIICVQHATPASLRHGSAGPSHRVGASLPSPSSHRYSNPCAEECSFPPLSPLPSEPDEQSDTAIPFRPFWPRAHYNYDSETESSGSLDVQPTDHLPRPSQFRGSNPSLSGDFDHPPLSPMSDVSCATFGRRTQSATHGSHALAPSIVLSGSPLLAPRGFSSSERIAPDIHRLSGMAISSDGDSFVTANAALLRYSSSSGYLTANEDPFASPHASVIEDDIRDRPAPTLGRRRVDESEFPNSPEGRWSLPSTPCV